MLALGGCKKDEKRVGGIQSLDKVVLEESLTPTPWGFHPKASKKWSRI